MSTENLALANHRILTTIVCSMDRETYLRFRARLDLQLDSIRAKEIASSQSLRNETKVSDLILGFVEMLDDLYHEHL